VKRWSLRRWAVPIVTLATIVVPIGIGLLFPDLRGFGGFGFCEECADCIWAAEGEIEPLDLDLDEPDDPDEGTQGVVDHSPPDPAPDGDADAPKGDPRLGTAGRIQDAVTRPRVDSQLNHGPDYKPPTPRGGRN